MIEIVLQKIITTGGGVPAGADYLIHYLDEVARQANLLPWANLTPDYATPGKGESLRLADVYTALDTTDLRHMEREEDLRQFLARQKEVERISAQEKLNEEDRLLILGDPGSGKSTFVKYVAYLLAQIGLADDPSPWISQLSPWEWGELIPLRVALRQVAAWGEEKETKNKAATLLKYLQHQLEEMALEEFWPQLKKKIRNRDGQVLFLFDGLDEVPTARRQWLVDMVKDFSQRYSQHRYVVTCRPYAYVGQPWQLTDFHEVTLAPFNEEQAEHFVENWYRCLAKRGRIVAGDAPQRIKQLKRAAQRSDLRGLAERPLLLTVMAQLHTFSGQLPEDRTQLYADSVDLLLQRWESRLGGEEGLLERLDIPGLKMSDLEAGLYDVAYQAHSGSRFDEGTADIEESDLRKWLASYLDDDWNKAGEFVTYIRERAGLLIRHKTDAYTFPHRSFQEFLAGCHWVGMDDYPLEAAKLIREDYDRWREVFVLAAGHAARTHRLGLAIAAVNALLPESIENVTAPKTGDWIDAQLASESLLEIGLLGVKRETMGKAVYSRSQKWLAAALGASKDLRATQRAKAGNVLGKLGDRREEILEVDAMPFCYVPEGPFLMGSTEKRKKRMKIVNNRSTSWTCPPIGFLAIQSRMLSIHSL